MIYQDSITFETSGRESINIAKAISDCIKESKISKGLCHLFLQHTSASLILCENYDPDVRKDLETFMQRLIPDGDKMFRHTMEGPDDMPAHIRSVITHNDLTIPISQGKLVLGTWQSVFLWEHRTHAHQRTIYITILGES